MRRPGVHLLPVRPGFTLLELVVSITIVAILAMILIPRLGTHRHRAMDLSAQQVADLLTMLALREPYAPRPVGLLHEVEGNRLRLVLMGGPDDDVNWIPIGTVAPVSLSPIVAAGDLEAWIDGDPVEITRWPWFPAPGLKRPLVEFVLRTEDRVLVVSMPSHAIAPTIREEGADATPFRSPVDLDGTGRTREEW